MQSTGNADLGPAWASFRAHQRGWVRQLELAGSAHLSYTDQLPMTAQRAYVAALFDQHLRSRDCGLFDGPSPAYPEIGFV